MVVRVFLSLVWVRKTMASCISLLSLFFMMVLFVLEERVCIPSCEVFSMNPEDLRVMMVSDLLLRGSEAGFMDVYFRDFYMAKFFRKSFEKLKPDMLVVLGDVSAKGSELPNNKWLSVLQQLQRVLGPLFELPLHIVVGERDIGDCSNLDSDHVSQVCSSLPGLNSCGCGAFSVSNISFLSLNSIPMLCNKNNLRFGVEKFIEKESLELRVGEKSINEEASESKEWRKRLHEREIAVKYGSGPVLLLHFPLHRRTGSTCKCIETPERNYWDKFPHDNPSASENFEIFGSGAHKVLCTIPPNASEYILQALGPRYAILLLW
ncbi:metallophosphoesterase 1 isoform X1 [Amborella trichopoda]|uniref:metallophosphoesterase 1 isoform X1 n=2 Tax=Amborella trichopoda TaxID=13333 RepID=UPI0009C17826|nr:metallophosphoesterase 1 isoform X1 [Amborella trichopoda]XP_020522246.1 metallophosphoesterase 1 isoform X1 [Amborella trichopoda]|eukprot:XP_020522239.1 metallophosphoesterase 1 isoform X1 [Amborella trichopoda]